MKRMLCWILLLVLLSACQEPQDQQTDLAPPIRPAQVWTTQTQMTAQMATYTGEVRARQTVDFAFRVAGKIVARHVNVGDSVTAGQALARLDDEDSRLSVQQTESALQATLGSLSSAQSNLNGAQGRLSSAHANRLAAQANLEAAHTAVNTARANANAAQAAVGVAQAEVNNAQLEYQRSRQLFDQNFASQAVLDRDIQRLKTAQSNLKSAQAQARAAQSEVQSALARVKTSQAQIGVIDGEIASAAANIKALDGQVKTAQAQVDSQQNQLQLTQNQSTYTVLTSSINGIVTETLAEVGQVVAAGQSIVRIAQQGDYEVHIRIGEQAIQKLQIGAPAAMSLWANPDAGTFQGRVREIAPNADNSRTWRVKLSLEDAPASLHLGMTTNVVLFQQTASQALVWLPATALFQQEAEQPAVWLLGADNTVQLKPVQVERYSEEGLLVSGLDADLTVVAAGVDRLYAGQTIRPVPYDGEAAPTVTP